MLNYKILLFKLSNKIQFSKQHLLGLWLIILLESVIIYMLDVIGMMIEGSGGSTLSTILRGNKRD